MTIKSSLRQDLLVLDATNRISARTAVVAHERVTTVEEEVVRAVAEVRSRRPVVAVVTTMAGIAKVVIAITSSREKYLRKTINIGVFANEIRAVLVVLS